MNKLAKPKHKPPQKQELRLMSKKLIESMIEDHITKAKQESVEITTRSLSAAFIISLADEFQFGPTRLQRLIDRVVDQYDCMLDGTVTTSDIEDWCKTKGYDYERLFGKNENTKR